MSDCRCWLCSPRDRKAKHLRKVAAEMLKQSKIDAREARELKYYPFLGPDRE